MDDKEKKPKSLSELKRLNVLRGRDMMEGADELRRKINESKQEKDSDGTDNTGSDSRD